MKFLGGHILEGMGITLRHFIDTYIEDYRRWRNPKTETEKKYYQEIDVQGIVTVQYPDDKLPVPERYRALPVLIYEAETGDVRCTSCGICAKVCPPQCIWIVQAKTPDGKIKPKPAEFFIDVDVCMNCGFCAEYCPFDAIKMDHNFELSNYERHKSHIYNLQDLLVSTEYYAKTHPVAWAEEEAARRKKEEAKKKPPAAAAPKPAAPPAPGGGERAKATPATTAKSEGKSADPGPVVEQPAPEAPPSPGA